MAGKPLRSRSLQPHPNRHRDRDWPWSRSRNRLPIRSPRSRHDPQVEPEREVLVPRADPDGSAAASRTASAHRPGRPARGDPSRKARTGRRVRRRQPLRRPSPMAAPGFPFPSRLAFVRAAMRAAGLDALVVTHPPNVFYLSGFSGTAGALVVDAHKATLVVDSRYVTAARALRDEHPGLSTLGVVLSDGPIDETLVQLLRAQERPRIGIEAASMPVLRFNRLSSSLAADAPLGSGLPLPVLVPTERLVERSRIVKDEAEIATLRTAARKLSHVAATVTARARPAGPEQADGGGHRRRDARRRLRAAGLRDHRGVGPQQRAAARPAGPPDARGGRRGGAGLRGRLRRILRGFDADRPAGAVAG